METHQRESSNSGIHTILCADWGKEVRKRAVYAADIGARLVYRLRTGIGWSIAEILKEAARLSSFGPVFATFDAPLGVPESYFSAAAATVPSWQSAESFLQLLQRACLTAKFFDATNDPTEWKVAQPFFSVPVGEGGLTSYIDKAAKQGIDLRRAMDKKTKAKTLFAKSGIPGSVGSAACALWREIGPLLDKGRDFVIGPLKVILIPYLNSHR